MLIEYSNEIIQKMCCLYESLSEKDRRRYAAIEAKKLGHGGVVFISTLFDCDEKTIHKGLIELDKDRARSLLGHHLTNSLNLRVAWKKKQKL